MNMAPITTVAIDSIGVGLDVVGGSGAWARNFVGNAEPPRSRHMAAQACRPHCAQVAGVFTAR